MWLITSTLIMYEYVWSHIDQHPSHFHVATARSHFHVTTVSEQHQGDLIGRQNINRSTEEGGGIRVQHISP